MITVIFGSVLCYTRYSVLAWRIQVVVQMTTDLPFELLQKH